MRDERVFLNYRRSDAAGVATRLRSELDAAFGPGRVFRDVESTEGGEEFPLELRFALERSVLVVALIGPTWVSELRDRAASPSRIDFVAHELALARKLGVPILPVLVDSAQPLQESELPDDLAFLARLHALPLRNATWAADFPAVLLAVRRGAGLRAGHSGPQGESLSRRLGPQVKGLLELVLRPRRFLLRYCRGEPVDFVVLALVVLVINIPMGAFSSAVLIDNVGVEAIFMGIGFVLSMAIHTAFLLAFGFVVFAILRLLGGRGEAARSVLASTYMMSFVAAVVSGLFAAGFHFGMMFDQQLMLWKVQMMSAPTVEEMVKRFNELPYYVSERLQTIASAVLIAAFAGLSIWLLFAWRAMAAIHLLGRFRSWAGLGLSLGAAGMLSVLMTRSL